MSFTKYSKPHTALALVRPKLELSNLSLDDKLELCGDFIAAQAEADPTDKLATETTALDTARKAINAKLELRAQIQAKIDANDADIVALTGKLNAALRDYTRAAAKLAGADPVVLSALGVDAAKKREPNGAHPMPEAPTELTIRPGVTPGEAILKCRKVAYAGSYVFEYKLEPSLPTDPWLPGGGIQTKLISATLSGLAPSQAIRARVRAIGALTSAWSEEVVGRAR